MIFCCDGRNCLVVVVLMVSTRRRGYGWCWFGRIVTGTRFIDVNCHGKDHKITKARSGKGLLHVFSRVKRLIIWCAKLNLGCLGAFVFPTN